MNNELYRAAIEAWGEDAQLDVAIEELSELIKEICKQKRGIGVFEHLVEEVADVEIMLEQIKLIFHIAEEDVAWWKSYKLSRLAENLRL